MTTEGPPQQNPEQAGIQKAEQLLDYMESSFGRNASPEGRQAFDFNKFWTDAKDLAGIKKGGIAILETPDFHLPFASYGANKELWGNVINALADEAENAYRNGNTSEKQKEVRKGLAVAVALGMNNTHGDHYLTATKEFIEGLRKIYGTKEPEEKFGNRVKHALTGRFRKRQPYTNQISDAQEGQDEKTEEENPFVDLIGELDSLADQNQKTEANEEVQQLLEELQKVYTIPEEESRQESNLRHKRQSEIEERLRDILALPKPKASESAEQKLYYEQIQPHALFLGIGEEDLQNPKLVALLMKLFETHSPDLKDIFEKFKSNPYRRDLGDLVKKTVINNPKNYFDERIGETSKNMDEALQAILDTEESFRQSASKGLIKTEEDFRKAILAKDQAEVKYWQSQISCFQAENEFYDDLAKKAGLQIIPGTPGEFATLTEAPTEEIGSLDRDLQDLLDSIFELNPRESAEALDQMGNETAASIFEEVRSESPDRAKEIAAEKAKINEEWFLQALKSGDRDEAELAYSSLNFEQRKKYRSQLDQFNNA